jgi:hypothetical protein
MWVGDECGVGFHSRTGARARNAREGGSRVHARPEVGEDRGAVRGCGGAVAVAVRSRCGLLVAALAIVAVLMLSRFAVQSQSAVRSRFAV